MKIVFGCFVDFTFFKKLLTCMRDCSGVCSGTTLVTEYNVANGRAQQSNTASMEEHLVTNEATRCGLKLVCFLTAMKLLSFHRILYRGSDVV